MVGADSLGGPEASSVWVGHSDVDDLGVGCMAPYREEEIVDRGALADDFEAGVVEEAGDAFAEQHAPR